MRVADFTRMVFDIIFIILLTFAALALVSQAKNGASEKGRQAQELSRIELAKTAISELEEERDRLTKKIAGLTLPEIDADLLDERARYMLGLSRPDEITIRNGFR